MVDIRRLPVGEEIEGITVTLDELARENERDADGKRLVMRNGRGQADRPAEEH